MSVNSDRESYELKQILARARKAKGADLTPEEIARFEKVAAEIAQLEEEIAELQAKEYEAETQELKAAAEAVVQREVEKARKEPLSDEKKKEILAERAEIIKRLKELGYGVKDKPES
jgi:hypothetical protein